MSYALLSPDPRAPPESRASHTWNACNWPSGQRKPRRGSHFLAGLKSIIWEAPETEGQDQPSRTPRRASTYLWAARTLCAGAGPKTQSAGLSPLGTSNFSPPHSGQRNALFRYVGSTGVVSGSKPTSSTAPQIQHTYSSWLIGLSVMTRLLWRYFNAVATRTQKAAPPERGQLANGSNVSFLRFSRSALLREISVKRKRQSWR